MKFIADSDIRENPIECDWHLLCWQFAFSEADIIEFADYLDWEMIICHQDISDNICKKYAGKILEAEAKYKSISWGDGHPHAEYYMLPDAQKRFKKYCGLANEYNGYKNDFNASDNLYYSFLTGK